MPSQQIYLMKENKSSEEKDDVIKLKQQLKMWKLIAALSALLALILLLAFVFSLLALYASTTRIGPENEKDKMMAENEPANLTDEQNGKLNGQKLAAEFNGTGQNASKETGIAKLDRHGADPTEPSCHQWNCLATSWGAFEWIKFEKKSNENSTDLSFIPKAVLITDSLWSWRAKMVPIPNVPVPQDYAQFNGIEIDFLDYKVLNFIKLIEPKLKNIDVSLLMDMSNWGPEEGRTKALHSLLNLLANKFGQLKFYGSSLATFNRLIPGYIDKIESLYIDFLAESGLNELLVNWLIIDGKKQQILEFTPIGRERREDFVGRIKTEFMNATTPHNFFVNFNDYLEKFTLENEKTGEVLTLYMNFSFDYIYSSRMLLRCPKGEEERWKKEGLEKLAKYRRKHDRQRTHITLNFTDVGLLQNLA